MAIIRTWSGDGLSPTTLTTSSAGPGDTVFSSIVGSLTIENSGGRAPRIRLPDAAAIKRVHWWPLHGTPLTTYTVRWYLTLGGYPDAEITLAKGQASGSGDKWSVRLTTAGVARIRDDGAGVVRWTGGTALPLNKPIRFELVVNGTSVNLSLFSGDTENSLGTATTTLNDSAIDELRFGTNSSTATNGMTYDDIAFHSVAAAHGPAGTPGQVHTHFIHNGTSWVAQDVSFL
ncbi:MAG TPA: hypothetical protein PKD19_02545 [Candidatus Saccharibacteria bacterium]|nr:hypothetical protein [Candidatus Saccharibacteria bacterium]HMR38514.1 hypothetical protein [Candidatus Saccharibacteria bacterium]